MLFLPLHGQSLRIQLNTNVRNFTAINCVKDLLECRGVLGQLISRLRLLLLELDMPNIEVSYFPPAKLAEGTHWSLHGIYLFGEKGFLVPGNAFAKFLFS